MKKLLVTATIALFALVGFGTTQTTHASSDIWVQYWNDAKAIKGTFVALNCEFGSVVNTYSYSSDGVGAKDDILFGIGKYEVTLPHTTLKTDHKYALVMQKTEGGNGPNFVVEVKANVPIINTDWKNFSDLKDHAIHTENFEFNYGIKSETPTFFEGCFGSHTSGTERIEAYIRDLEA